MEIILVCSKAFQEEHQEELNGSNLNITYVTENINEDNIFDQYNFNKNIPKVLAIATQELLEWRCPKELIERLGNVKAICTKSSWMEYIDLNYCKKNNIPVLNNTGVNSQSVAENAIFMMFALARKLPLQMSEKFDSTADSRHEHIEIFGKTVGIFGLGHIGKRIAKMCNGLGMKVTYWSQNTRDENYIFKTPDTLIKESDFVFNCLETKAETANFFNKKLLSGMKDSSYFVSVIGGCGYKIEDNDYLINAVIEGKIAGYAIENEHHKSYTLPNIPEGTNIFMPGAYGYFTKEANTRAFENWMKNIKTQVNSE
jgi:phosphoglycerate dehydrogenase-like enzyme